MTKLLAWLRDILNYPLNPFERLMVAWLTALSVFTCLASPLACEGSYPGAGFAVMS